MKEQLWEQLKTNEYGVREKGKRIDKKEKKKKKKNKRTKKKRRYVITSIGECTEGIKAILKKEGFNKFRKGGGKLETKVKKEYKKETRDR